MPSPTSTSSSLSSGERFGLDDKSRSKILVYDRPDGISFSSQQELCKKLDNSMFLSLFPCIHFSCPRSGMEGASTIIYGDVRLSTGNSSGNLTQNRDNTFRLEGDATSF